MSIDLARTIAKKVDDTLHQQGFTRIIGGEEIRVPIASVRLAPDKFVAIELDVHNLPPKVTLAQLMSANVLHHLSTVLEGREVMPVNTTGMIYVVRLQEELPELAEYNELDAPEEEYAIPIGVSRGGPVWKSLHDIGHILIGGTTQSGKSSWLKSLVVHAGKNPNIEVLVIDPKVVGFVSVKDYIDKPIASTVDDAELIVNYVLKEMNKRKEYFKLRNIESFKNNTGDEKLILLVIDEFTTIALQAGLDSPFYANLTTLAAQAAAFGIHLILATQNPKAEVMNTLIRSNCDTRICFRVASPSASRIVLDEVGADRINTKGRFIFKSNSGRSTLMQGYLYTTNKDAFLPLHKELALYAIEKLQGRFTLAKLTEQFKGRITNWELQQTADLWESLGYLEKTGPAKNSPRVVTDVLKQMVQE